MSYEPRVKEHFKQALLRAKTCLSIYDFVANAAPAALDATDLLRSSVVLGVSALDYLVHLVIRFEVEDRVLHQRQIAAVTIPIEFTYLDSASLIRSSGLHIKSVNGYKSFVNPAKLAEGLKPLLDDPWDSISAAFGRDSKELRRELTLIVDTRNRIAHEGDLDPELITPDSYRIERDDVYNSMGFMEKLGDSIVEAVISRQSEMSMADFSILSRFPVNLRKTEKGTPKGSITVHRMPNGCRHARNHPMNRDWDNIARWVDIRRMARTKSLGCCRHCWSQETAVRTAELQGLHRP